MRQFIAIAVLAISASVHAASPTDTITLVDKKSGDETLSDVQVDTAPGSVSASSMLSLSGDTVKDVQNPRDLALLLQAFDASNSFGVSVTPARMPLIPIALADYLNHTWVRLAASTTIGYAQTTASVGDNDFHERAWSIESSAYIGSDDTLVAWSDALGRDQPCGEFVSAQKPDKTPAEVAAANAAAQPAGVPASQAVLKPTKEAPDSPVKKDIHARHAECTAYLAEQARWNTSRVWASFASGTYQGAASGSPSHGLGRTIVVGASYGIGKNSDPGQWQATVGMRRNLREPILATYGDASPQFRNSTLATLRLAYGRTNLRALIEASNSHDDAPTASGRTFKRALGLDLRIAKGTWINFRVGRQRKLDNSGDETGSSVLLNISPTSLLSFGS